MKSTFLLIGALLTPSLWAQSDHAGHTHTEAKPKSTAPEILSLDIAVADQVMHVLVAEYQPATDQTVLLHQRSSDDGLTWSAPSRVDANAPAPLARGRGMDFQITAHQANLTAVWMTAGTGYGASGPLVSARSTDGGMHWQPATTPADDGTTGGHGFIDLATTPHGVTHAVWLDNRTGAGQGLRTASSPDHGRTWSPNRTIDARTCECCWNILQADAAGYLYCLYRDHEPRDMIVSLSSDGGTTWQPLAVPGAFKWNFNGCPHVGGALAIAGSGSTAKVHAIVWTGVTGRTGLYYLNTAAPDYRWSEPQRVGGAQARFSDLAVSSAGVLAATWTEASAEGAQLYYQLSSDGGLHWLPAIKLSTPQSQPSHPRIVTSDQTFQLVWTEKSGAGSTWRHHAIKIP